MSKNRKLLIKLYRKYKGRCQYCGTNTISPKSGEDIKGDYVATVEHLFSRDDIRRYLFTRNEKTILSCHYCNAVANKAFETRVGKYEYSLEVKWEPHIINIVRMLWKVT